MSAKKKKRVDLQMALIVEGGEIVLRVLDDESTVLTVRSAEKEEKAEVGLTHSQALVLVDMLGRVPGDGDDWDSDD